MISSKITIKYLLSNKQYQTAIFTKIDGQKWGEWDLIKDRHVQDDIDAEHFCNALINAASICLAYRLDLMGESDTADLIDIDKSMTVTIRVFGKDLILDRKNVDLSKDIDDPPIRLVNVLLLARNICLSPVQDLVQYLSYAEIEKGRAESLAALQAEGDTHKHKIGIPGVDFYKQRFDELLGEIQVMACPICCAFNVRNAVQTIENQMPKEAARQYHRLRQPDLKLVQNVKA